MALNKFSFQARLFNRLKTQPPPFVRNRRVLLVVQEVIRLICSPQFCLHKIAGHKNRVIGQPLGCLECNDTSLRKPNHDKESTKISEPFEQRLNFPHASIKPLELRPVPAVFFSGNKPVATWRFRLVFGKEKCASESVRNQCPEKSSLTKTIATPLLWTK